jgi:hypothetical protein
MSETDHKKIISALFVALRPLAKMLLRVGVGYKEFSSVAKSVFVQVSTQEFGIRGRQTNTSRIAAMNGLSRKEVTKVREGKQELLIEFSLRESPLSQLLHEWSSNSKYLDLSGNPRSLPYAGDDVSFTTLVAECARDIPPGAMRAELTRVGSIAELPDKKLKLIKKYFVPSDIDGKLEIGIKEAINTLGETVAFNCDPNRKEPLRFQRLVSLDDFPTDRIEFVQKFTSEKLRVVSEEVDDYLSEQAAKGASSDSKLQVGVGLYYYQILDE